MWCYKFTFLYNSHMIDFIFLWINNKRDIEIWGANFILFWFFKEEKETKILVTLCALIININILLLYIANIQFNIFMVFKPFPYSSGAGCNRSKGLKERIEYFLLYIMWMVHKLWGHFSPLWSIILLLY